MRVSYIFWAPWFRGHPTAWNLGDRAEVVMGMSGVFAADGWLRMPRACSAAVRRVKWNCCAGTRGPTGVGFCVTQESSEELSRTGFPRVPLPLRRRDVPPPERGDLDPLSRCRHHRRSGWIGGEDRTLLRLHLQRLQRQRAAGIPGLSYGSSGLSHPMAGSRTTAAFRWTADASARSP